MNSVKKSIVPNSDSTKSDSVAKFAAYYFFVLMVCVSKPT